MISVNPSIETPEKCVKYEQLVVTADRDTPSLYWTSAKYQRFKGLKQAKQHFCFQ